MRLIMFLILLLSFNAFAAEEGAHGIVHLPWGMIISQIANFTILILILFFTQRKKISQYFADKRAEFVNQVEAASNSKKEAQNQLQEVKARVDKLESSFDQQVEEAKKNAEESYRTQLAEAKNEAMRMKNLTQTSLEFEAQREIEKLRLEVYEKSAEIAEKDIESKMTPEQQRAWNSHFVQNVKGAH